MKAKSPANEVRILYCFRSGRHFLHNFTLMCKSAWANP